MWVGGAALDLGPALSIVRASSRESGCCTPSFRTYRDTRGKPERRP